MWAPEFLRIRLRDPASLNGIAFNRKPKARAFRPNNGEHRVPDSDHARRSNRKGVSLIEMIVAVVLLGAVMTTAVPVFGWTIQQRRAANQRQFAIQEVANLMERVAADDWADVSKQSLEDLAPTQRMRQALSDPEWDFRVTQVDGPPVAKRVKIQVTWRDRAGNQVSPVRLIGWLHQHGGTE